jgi:Ca2+/Na+ antiporter
MLNKTGKYIRRLHRYLTPFFVIVTVLYMFVLQSPILYKLQRIMMLTMAVTGTFLFIQIYYNKYRNKKRRTLNEKQSTKI